MYVMQGPPNICLSDVDWSIKLQPCADPEGGTGGTCQSWTPFDKTFWIRACQLKNSK